MHHLVHRILSPIMTVGLLSACGFTGGTRPFVVEFEAADASALVKRVTLDSFKVEKGASVRFMPGSGVIGIGAFSEKDEEVLAQSVEDSLSPIDWPRPTEAKDDLKLKIILRRHVLAAGWDMAVLAIVAWALVDSDGKLVHHEQFYATVHSENKMWTLGHIKNRANRAIANRVVGSSLVIAAGKNIDEFLPYEGTFETFGEAKETVPYKYWIPPIIVPGNSEATIFGAVIEGGATVVSEGALEGIDWDQYDKTVPINWGRALYGEEIVPFKYAVTPEIPEINLTDFEPDLCKVTPELPPERSMVVGSALFTEKRYREAYMCYLRVAESDTAWAHLQHKAYLKLGIMSELGWGTEPSLAEAKMWYQKAGIL